MYTSTILVSTPTHTTVHYYTHYIGRVQQCTWLMGSSKSSPILSQLNCVGGRKSSTS